MRFFAKKILGIVLVIAVLLISSHGLAREPSKADQISGVKQETLVAPPDLADIVPSATELSGRLAALENRTKGGLDISALEKKYDGIEANLKNHADQLQQLKNSKGYKYDKLVRLREAINQESKMFEKISKPISQEIRQLGAWRKEWLAEKKRWNEWQSFLLKEKELDQLKSTFEKAKRHHRQGPRARPSAAGVDADGTGKSRSYPDKNNHACRRIRRSDCRRAAWLTV